MKMLTKIAAAATATAMTAQPCLAAAAGIAPAGARVSMAAERVDFDLQRQAGSVAGQAINGGASGLAAAGSASASLTLAASQQTAAEADEQSERRGPGTTTWLIIGGVVLLVVIAAVVASATPPPGPDGDDF